MAPPAARVRIDWRPGTYETSNVIAESSGATRTTCDTLLNLSNTALEQMGDVAAHGTLTLAGASRGGQVSRAQRLAETLER